jgi:hypothetical protein
VRYVVIACFVVVGAAVASLIASLFGAPTWLQVAAAIIGGLLGLVGYSLCVAAGSAGSE